MDIKEEYYYLDNNKLNINKIDQNKHIIDWNKFTYKYSKYITIDIILLYNKINYNILYDNICNNITLEFIKSMHININKLSFNFINIFAKFINWDYISIKQMTNLNLIMNFKDKINWDYISISLCNSIDKNFIKMFRDNINVNYITNKHIIKELNNISYRHDKNYYNNAAAYRIQR